MIELLCFILCIIAFSCFAHAKATHYRDIYGVRPNARLVSKILICAWISILLSLLLSIIDQAGYGALLFCGYMSLSVLILVVLFSFIEDWVKFVGALNSLVLLTSCVFLLL